MNKFYYLELRFLLILIISIMIIIFDGKLNMFFQVKKYASDSVDLLYYLYDGPCYIFSVVSKILKGYKKIILENHALHQELLIKKSELLLLDQYQQENYRLRELIQSPLCCKKRKIISRVIFINTDPWIHQIVVNKGTKNDVYVGQPVITDEGIVGQVIAVNKFSSRVLLIYDANHALPVQIKRNNTRMILIGRGYNDMSLYAECSIEINICIGDILVTSGLDGRFPEGYPVAIVSNILINKEQDFMTVYAIPTVKFQKLRNALLIWK